MSTEPAHFTRTDDGAYLPTPFAQSHWGDDHLNGPAVVGLVARVLETQCGSDDFMPARLTVDLFKAARGVPTTVEVRVVRDGRRVRSAECDVRQDGKAVARATLLQYRRSSAPPGEQWIAPVSVPKSPPPDGETLPYIGSEEAGWTRSPSVHQNASRKCFFNDGIDVVAGKKNSPFVRAVMVAESTSLVTNLGTKGIGYINGDLTVALSRLPLDDWLAVQADSHWAADGIAVGTATLFDHQGPFGSGMVTAVANPAAQIDFSNRQFPVAELNYE
ncbi:acyl-CoA thioesterase domain-containing protein [Mycolicibacterium holsaticum]|uniref:acyl-CoA thioesterase domain-containing protein n=1 Tax=Mycolicibacterium holsaticum TaxID=152142 RepID=UPI001C7D45DF|nr:acyl-CoA thioesterase domain-containing protein [Mycolicibacterium holsaticum]MDA4107837.1 thioesterase [Mycolicibacterium holsaticum DSM 44478 = JCM 12374]QZA14720.1 thioesterase family protein [Mycolicibacterium holsaticum DSM 44478 = JCM 12374]UNC07837.1 thioesterase family protein [Mycolicibacterium holsaticum DSM 44478 = JCM 12374]